MEKFANIVSDYFHFKFSKIRPKTSFFDFVQVKPCEKLRQDPFQCSNLTYEPLAYLVCPMKFRCSNQSNDSMIMSSSSTMQYPKAGQDVTESPTTKMSNPRGIN